MPGQTTVRTTDLNVDDEVAGRISVVGSDESNLVTFMVSGPLGNVVLPAATVVVSDFNFKAVEGGHVQFCV